MLCTFLATLKALKYTGNADSMGSDELLRP